jgi:hypothetical protein
VASASASTTVTDETSGTTTMAAVWLAACNSSGEQRLRPEQPRGE